MKVALVNPPWTFDGSIYFGCREPHLPLELGYARALLREAGHQAELVDAQLEGLTRADLRGRIAELAPDLAVIPTAPSYLFWRCPPPELRVPRETATDLRGLAQAIVIVGPHGSTSPVTTLEKLDADVVVLGECEEVLVALAGAGRGEWDQVPSIARREPESRRVRVQGGPHQTDLARLPPLDWPAPLIARHGHHHHRFETDPNAPGGELEASRGCPYRCTFCAKETHRDRYRKRPLDRTLAELDGLIGRGVEYVYFIDEIFLPDERLLDELTARHVRFGVQTRIDLWSFEMIDRLGAAGCVSIEAGVESVSPEGRAQLDKRCRLSTDELSQRLIRAKNTVGFVQATLMESKADDAGAVAAFRERLREHGVWSNDPVPLFPYPGSPDYRRLWGEPDERAWERAHEHYLTQFTSFSDIQDERPVRLPILEGHHGPESLEAREP